jgi:GTP pyrophosphokinase
MAPTPLVPPLTEGRALLRLALAMPDREGAFVALLEALGWPSEAPALLAAYLAPARAGEPLRRIGDRARIIAGLRYLPGGRVPLLRVQEALRAIDPEGSALLLASLDHFLSLCGRWGTPSPERALFALHALAPMTEAIGAGGLRREMEDLAFRSLDRPAYEQLAAQIALRSGERDELLAGILQRISRALGGAGLTAQITGRAKHLWSIHRKVARKGRLCELHDLLGVRLITEDLDSCYQLLGALHGAFSPVPGRFKDYIARPRMTGYRSLHTTLQIDAPSAIVEVQVRTRAMHEEAEHGCAAHWRYKSGSAMAEPSPRWIFPVTPAGDVLRLPRGATALDFAYAIHSALGERFLGALVDGKPYPAHLPLASGQQVLLLTSSRQGPSPGQIEKARTHHARNRIRAALRGKKVA